MNLESTPAWLYKNYPGTDWKRVLCKNTDVLTNDFKYFKVKLVGETTWNPQIGSLRFYYDQVP